MADETKNVTEQEVPKVATEESSSTEVTDRGLFDFLGKKKDETKPEETTIDSEFEQKVHISEPAPEVIKVEHEEEEKKPSLLEKLHRSDSSSSSSSEEVGEDGEKRKKKKKDKKKTTTEVEVKTEEEKKGFMDKLKEKLPGHGKKTEDASTVAAAPVVTPHPVEEAHPVEKKGILEKIKEKLPGYHPKTTVEEEKKDKE
ncbi:PREDICTED: dehydrin ERD14-like [Camelina sativa]|uniref:Dehydrin ERD14-like n=1 Tax=Camelina sativa TaxID=90675 RepID=A0ABM0SV00_CAMSA|nr:PREDICTED: dehydrin ERD14-like [Camelina sativa]